MIVKNWESTNSPCMSAPITSPDVTLSTLSMIATFCSRFGSSSRLSCFPALPLLAAWSEFPAPPELFRNKLSIAASSTLHQSPRSTRLSAKRWGVAGTRMGEGRTGTSRNCWPGPRRWCGRRWRGAYPSAAASGSVASAAALPRLGHPDSRLPCPEQRVQRYWLAPNWRGRPGAGTPRASVAAASASVAVGAAVDEQAVGG